MNDTVMNEIEETQRLIRWYLIEDCLGENYSDDPYYVKAFILLRNCVSIEARSMAYLTLKNANDDGLNAAAKVWAKNHKTKFIQMRLHIYSIGLWLYTKHLFSAYIWYLPEAQ